VRRGFRRARASGGSSHQRRCQKRAKLLESHSTVFHLRRGPDMPTIGLVSDTARSWSAGADMKSLYNSPDTLQLPDRSAAVHCSTTSPHSGVLSASEICAAVCCSPGTILIGLQLVPRTRCAAASRKGCNRTHKDHRQTAWNDQTTNRTGIGSACLDAATPGNPVAQLFSQVRRKTKICDTPRERKNDAQPPIVTMLYCPGTSTCRKHPIP
jgi:hypothetical protein